MLCSLYIAIIILVKSCEFYIYIYIYIYETHACSFMDIQLPCLKFCVHL